ncbi:MAG: hypothetical protein ACOYJL_00685 [Tractidigestivibacter sp.]|jgi:FKBP-type peptidyl-prolyl cis-trans isomerase (trigger factor)|uniref:hypothetical protein n=1 Tax=Tractidigestivibacter sp. TaxID=2847320 RepID=UPI003D91E020
MTREEAWHGFVENYDIEVPPEVIESERSFIELDLRHRMQYDRLSGGDAHVFPSRELAEQEEALERAALFEAKEPLVLRALQDRLHLSASKEELAAKAEEMARVTGTTVDAVRKFFGDDLSMLSREVITQKLVDWAVEQSDASGC